jgi:hypothetical protein
VPAGHRRARRAPGRTTAAPVRNPEAATWHRPAATGADRRPRGERRRSRRVRSNPVAVRDCGDDFGELVGCSRVTGKKAVVPGGPAHRLDVAGSVGRRWSGPDAEAAGWHDVFVWDHLRWEAPCASCRELIEQRQRHTRPQGGPSLSRPGVHDQRTRPSGRLNAHPRAGERRSWLAPHEPASRAPHGRTARSPQPPRRRRSAG